MRALCCILLFTTSAFAEPQSNASEASVTALSVAPSTAIPASMSIVPVGSELIVLGVEASGNGAIASLQVVASGAELSIELSTESARALAELTGRSVSWIATSVGHALVAAGEVVLLVPDAAMVHSARIE